MKPLPFLVTVLLLRLWNTQKDKNSYLLGADMITIESESHQTMVKGGGVFHSKDNPYNEESMPFS